MAYFVDKGLKDCFAAALYICYDLLRPDVVLELAWRHRLTDLAMPFVIQVTREYVAKVDQLEKANHERTHKEEIKEKQGKFLSPGSYPIVYSLLLEMSSIAAPMHAPLMLTAAPAWGQGGYASAMPPQQFGGSGNPMFPPGF